MNVLHERPPSLKVFVVGAASSRDVLFSGGQVYATECPPLIPISEHLLNPSKIAYAKMAYYPLSS